MMQRCDDYGIMRTTIHLDDDVYEAVRSLAVIERTTAGKVLSRLARRALNPARSGVGRGGFPVFEVPADARAITPDMVRDAIDEA
jgi:hypothetical protein